MKELSFENKIERKFGLLGEKLSHSFSPYIHSMFGDYEYKLYEVAPNELEEWIKSNTLSGFNVTIPYKQTVMKYCDKLSEEAKRIGAVNTVIRLSDGTLYGDNTDYYGFEKMLTSTVNAEELKGIKALVAGSGGASKTVCDVLCRYGAECIVLSRSGENNYTNLERHSDAGLIVNTTPVGMYPNCDESPLEIDEFPRLCAVLDVVYNPLETKLLYEAREKNIRYENGLMMLVYQAKRAAEMFCKTQISESRASRVYSEMLGKFRNIILIGMPGSGKTTVGKLIAEKLGREFFDSDEEIEKESGISPAEMIVKYSEEKMREKETLALAHLSKKNGVVIATGGGTVTRKENLRHLRKNGKIYLLQRNMELLATEGRPLSNNLLELYEKRKDMYEKYCDKKISANGTADEVCEAIIKDFTEDLL